MAVDRWVEGGGGSSSSSSSPLSSAPTAYTGSESGQSSGQSSGGQDGGGSSGSGEGAKSRKNTYEQLERMLKPLFDEEWRGLDGTKPRKWFPERMGKKTYDEVFEEFLAGPHDDEWSKAWQDEHGSLSDMALHARAIGYMDSMWRELLQLYAVDEINSLAEERNAVGRWLSQDRDILDFLTPEAK